MDRVTVKVVTVHDVKCSYIACFKRKKHSLYGGQGKDGSHRVEPIVW